MFHNFWQRIVLGFLTILTYNSIAFGQNTFLPAEQQKNLKTYIPQELQLGPIQFYSHKPAFQMGNQLVSIFAHVNALPDPFGNANREMPWRITAGLQNSPPNDFHVYTFTNLTSQSPIRYYRGLGRFRHNMFFQNESPTLVWMYPTGTVFGELLLNANNQTFEVRTRTKNESNDWVPKVYRQYASVDDLPALNGIPARHYTKTVERHVTAHGVNENVVMTSIPKIPYENRRFVSTRFIVTTEEPNNIVPRNYMGTVTNCVNCHSQTQKHSRNITANREWYGNVRGSDQIFSFSIFDEKSIGSQQPPLFRKDLTIVPAN